MPSNLSLQDLVKRDIKEVVEADKRPLEHIMEDHFFLALVLVDISPGPYPNIVGLRWQIDWLQICLQLLQDLFLALERL